LCSFNSSDDDLGLFSHPNKLLRDHLRNVAKLARGIVEQYYPAENYDFEKMAHAAYVVGLTHDIGKSTSYFQEHLRGLKSKSGLSQHSNCLHW